MIIEHMQAMNRSLLNRLRPMRLAMFRWKICCPSSFRIARASNPYRVFVFGDQLSESYGDSIDLTIYRCTQEGVTNAIKHADAKRIDVKPHRNGP